jgi:HEAT repeat protein
MPKTAPKTPRTERRDRVREQLDLIRALRDAPRTEQALARLEEALADRSNLVVAAAATLVAEAELAELAPRLPPAFERFLIDPLRSDKGCKAKTAVVNALYRNQAGEALCLDIYRRGLRYVQPEPVWGGNQDTAAELRGLCALGLAQLDPPGVIEDLAELLADPEPTARALCARAIGASGQEAGLPLLRYKVRLGDPHPEVLMECCLGLIWLSPRRSLPFVGELLERGDAPLREAAAMALGQSRREEALPLLLRFAESRPAGSGERWVALTAVAVLRSSEALAYLLKLVREAAPELAAQAVRALALHRYDEALRGKVEADVRARQDAGLSRACAEAFGLASRQ